MIPKVYSPWAFRRMLYRGRYYHVDGSALAAGFRAEHLTLENGHHKYIRSERLEQVLLGNIMRLGVEVADFPERQAALPTRLSLGPLFDDLMP